MMILREEREVPEPPRREIFRYLGYRGTEPDENVREKVERCVRELKEVSGPRSVSSLFPLGREEDVLVFAGMRVRSRSLWKNLEGCSRVILFAATLGLGPDRLIQRASVRKASDMIIYQAAAAAMIEEVCDQLNREWEERIRREGGSLRPRFSPGYGDFALEHQREFLQAIDAARGAGITLTESCLMVPSKSVSAVIGVAE